MAIKYVDFEGEAGTGDGSSFANRAKRFSGLSCSAGDEIRVKQTPSQLIDKPKSFFDSLILDFKKRFIPFFLFSTLVTIPLLNIIPLNIILVIMQ